MTPNPFDQAARFAIKALDPLGFFQWILPATLASWQWTGWLDARRIVFPGEADRYCDTVAAFEHRQGSAPSVAAAVEIQLRPEGEMSARMAEYCLDIRRELPLQNDPTVRFNAVGIVLYLTGPKQPETWEMKPPDFDDLGLHIRVKTVSLREESAPATLQRIAEESLSRCVLPWVSLMKQGDDPAIIDEWKYLAMMEPNERKRAEYGALALILAEAADRHLTWKTALEDWNMVISKVVEEWQADKTREHIIHSLRIRFGKALPDSIVTAVESSTDPSLLDRWFVLSLTSPTLAEFESSVRSNGLQSH